MSPTLFTIGHSNHSIDHLLELLKQHSIQVVYDVRSQPYSRYNPQFNRETLRSHLERNGVHYAFLGKQLGGRSKNPENYGKGKVQYKAVAVSSEFKHGLEFVLNGMKTENAVLLCAEKDPINCHRAILVCRHIRNNGVTIQHILENGELESIEKFETRLIHSLKLPEQDLFSTREEIIELAYDLQSDKIAYTTDVDEPQSPREEKRVVHLYTIGFTKKSAEEFFTTLCQASVKRLIDVRLNNVSQLAGFTKKDDLRYFLRSICGVEYIHLPILAPTKELLDAYKKHKGEWSTYEKDFIELMKSRKVEELVSQELLDGACLLCSEEEPQYCHRRLVAEYLRDKWTNVDLEITHIT